MVQGEVIANFNDCQGIKTEVYDTTELPDEICAKLQLVHRDSIRANLPKEDWYRADSIVRLGDFPTYRDRRVEPKLQAGKDGWNEEQIFRRPLVTVTYDSSGEVASAVWSDDNSSGHKGLPKPLWLAEALIKMALPPELKRLPVIGGRRFVHLREAYQHPDAQRPLDVEPGTIAVGGLMVVGVYFSLADRHPKQQLADYKVTDPADADTAKLSLLLGTEQTGVTAKTIRGYQEGSLQIRSEISVLDARERIAGLTAANQVLESVIYRRISP